MTIFLITGSSSSKQKDRIDDGRGSKAHDFAHEAARQQGFFNYLNGTVLLGVRNR